MNLVEKAKQIAEENRIPSCHSDFQIENFIIGKETSVYGKMWQCVREIQSRCDNLENCQYEMEELDDNLAMAEIDLQKLQIKIVKSASLDLERLKNKKKEILVRKQKRKIQKLLAGKELLERKKKEITQELEVFTQVFLKLTENTEYLGFNDPKAQTQYWNSKFDHELNLAAMLGTPTNLELIKSCLALPDETNVKKQIVGVLNNINKKLLGKNN